MSASNPNQTAMHDQRKLDKANEICREIGFPELTQQEFDHYYGVDPLFHRINTKSPSRALEAEWRQGWRGTMRLSILWHEGIEGLDKAEEAAGIKGDAQFREFLDALPVLSQAASTLRALSQPE